MKALFEADVCVQMRDGTTLSTTLWRPEVDRKVPALLMRTPYQKDDLQLAAIFQPGYIALLRAGYAVVAQDTRGAFRSDGDFLPHHHETSDGEDTIRWLAEQPWCDGNVGMYGSSYLGLVQWQAAAADTPALKAIAPAITSADIYPLWYSPGGAMSLQILLSWSAFMAMNAALRGLANGSSDPADIEKLAALMMEPDALYRATPVNDQPLLTKYLPWLDDVLSHPARDGLWQAVSAIDRAEDVITPALSIAGWYDIFVNSQLSDLQAISARAGSERARTGQRLVIGPWTHNPGGQSGFFPDRQFGASASTIAAQFDPLYVSFFDRWLKGDENALEGRAPVRIFVMGIDRWRDEQAWPLPDTEFVEYYLDATGPSNTSAGDGVLTPERPARNVVDRYAYDPLRPVPTVGGTTLDVSNQGPRNQSAVEMRSDVLCFSSAVLDQTIEVTGPISVKLFVSSSALDTDFTAKLVDVFPDGRAINLCDGVLRMRYRNSLAQPELMTPGEVYEITIDLGATSNVFLPGHRIRLDISSSNFPRYDRNSNTGGNISSERAEEMRVALNEVRSGAVHDSRICLPIITRENR